MGNLQIIQILISFMMDWLSKFSEPTADLLTLTGSPHAYLAITYH